MKVLCYAVQSMIVCPPEGGQAEAGDYSATNLLLTLSPIQHGWQTSRLKSQVLQARN